MALVLDAVTRVVRGQVYIQPTDLVLEKGTMNVLLGPTLAGKTTLMRLMAGLDRRHRGAHPLGRRRRDRHARCRTARWRWSTSSSSTTRR